MVPLRAQRRVPRQHVALKLALRTCAIYEGLDDFDPNAPTPSVPPTALPLRLRVALTWVPTVGKELLPVEGRPDRCVPGLASRLNKRLLEGDGLVSRRNPSPPPLPKLARTVLEEAYSLLPEQPLYLEVLVELRRLYPDGNLPQLHVILHGLQLNFEADLPQVTLCWSVLWHSPYLESEMLRWVPDAYILDRVETTLEWDHPSVQALHRQAHDTRDNLLRETAALMQSLPPLPPKE